MYPSQNAAHLGTVILVELNPVSVRAWLLLPPSVQHVWYSNSPDEGTMSRACCLEYTLRLVGPPQSSVVSPLQATVQEVGARADPARESPQ